MNIVNKLNHVEINVRYRQMVNEEIIDQNSVSVMIFFYHLFIHLKNSNRNAKSIQSIIDFIDLVIYILLISEMTLNLIETVLGPLRS